MSERPSQPPSYDTIFNCDEIQIDPPPPPARERLTKCPVYSSIAIIVLVVLTIIILAACYGVSRNQPTRYLLAIDCGLKASKFSLFRYKENPFRTNAWIEQLSYSSISPGITSYVGNPAAGADAILQKANSVITTEVPKDSQKDTRVFLGAVAGVRLLEYQDKTKADALVKAVQDAFGGPNLAGIVMNVPQDVKVVPGIEQGYDAWLAVNYLEGNFGAPKKETAKPAEYLLGALNMGGASSQIAFYTTAAIQSADDKYNGVVFGKEYNLYCHTNLCYGIATLGDRYLALLASRASAFTNPITSPCHLKDFSVTVQTNSIFQSPCVSQTDNGITGPPIIKPSGIPDNITFSGSYNMKMCLSVVDELFQGTPFEQPQRPPLSGDFTAIHKIWETVHAFVGGTTLAIKTTLSGYTNIVDNFCQQDWSAIPAEQKPPGDKCLHGWLVREMLKYYGFKSEAEWVNITFLGGVEESIASWSTGYALDSSSKIPSTSPQINMDTTGFWVGTAVLIIALFIAIAVLILDCRSRK